MKKLLVTGANGQLATEYQLSSPIPGWDYLFLDRAGLDIADLSQVEEVMSLWDFDAVLNLAAYTNVEKAEKEETDKAFDANAVGPKNLATSCKVRNIPLIHISTDYVFDGSSTKPYTEEDLENPINQYGRTKFVGEKWIQEMHDWYYIIRVAWVYSNHSKNFFTTMLNLSQERTELNVVDDQYGSPTSTKEICKAIDSILNNLDKKLSGIYHFNGLGKTTWKDFAVEIFNQCKVSIVVNPVSSSSWASKVMRPVYSYMSSEKFSQVFNYAPMHWKNSLKDVVAERKIVPVKVGDIVMSENNKECVIISTDWLKKKALISPLDNMKTYIEVPFEILTLR
jgi:dTDP-4-dehydrorhamnose reductase